MCIISKSFVAAAVIVSGLSLPNTAEAQVSGMGNFAHCGNIFLGGLSGGKTIEEQMTEVSEQFSSGTKCTGGWDTNKGPVCFNWKVGKQREITNLKMTACPR